jgi:hypothetical protein
MNIFSWVRRAPVLGLERSAPDQRFEPQSARAPTLIPYDNGPPVLSPWCDDAAARTVVALQAQCPFLSGLPGLE